MVGGEIVNICNLDVLLRKSDQGAIEHIGSVIAVTGEVSRCIASNCGVFGLYNVAIKNLAGWIGATAVPHGMFSIKDARGDEPITTRG